MKFSIAAWAATMLALACTTTSVTGRKQLNFVPDGQMSRLGEQAYSDILKKEKLSTDRRLTARVQQIGQDIAKASGKDFAWAFNLIDKDQVNAFCLPGGKVGVYTGILPVAANDAGLAAILGHEVAHAVLRHGAERMSQALAMNAGLTLATLSMKNQKNAGLIAGALGVGLQFGVMLPFSRSHESEADRVGLRYMAKAGYDPSEAPRLWQRMAAKGGRVPEVVSTHPDPLARAKALQSQIPSVARLYESSNKRASNSFR